MNKNAFFKVLTFFFICTCSGNGAEVQTCLDIDTEKQTLDIRMSNGLHYMGPYDQGKRDTIIFQGFDGQTKMKLREGSMYLKWQFQLFGWGLHEVECYCKPAPSRASISIDIEP